jgi:hypothetical protein
MSPGDSDARRRKMFRRAAATIQDLAIRDMVMAAPHKAFFGRPTDPVGSVWRPAGPVPEADPPIAAPFLRAMLELLRRNFSVMLIADDRHSRNRAVALLKAALDDEVPSALS